MLYYSAEAPTSGFGLNLANAGDLAPPDLAMDPDEYRGYLRARWRENPRPFIDLARRAAAGTMTIVSSDRPDLAAVLWNAIVGVAAVRKIGSGPHGIAGGRIAPTPVNVSGRYR